MFWYIVLALLFLLILLIRLIHYLINLGKNKIDKVENVRTIICMGSGGHTAEMIRILNKMDFNSYKPRLYLIANTDTTSEDKVLALEQAKLGSKDAYRIGKISRSRHVLQSYFSSVWTTLHSFFTSIPLVYAFKPDLLICNGPGTCVPICFQIVLMNLFYLLNNCSIIFIESICRVRSLSLSGLLLYFISDLFIVQWKYLQHKYSKAKYFGRLS